jgi:hypothetical protein
LAILAPKLGKLGEEKLRKLLKNGRTDALSTLTEHPVSLSAGGGPNISFHQAGHHVTLAWGHAGVGSAHAGVGSRWRGGSLHAGVGPNYFDTLVFSTPFSTHAHADTHIAVLLKSWACVKTADGPTAPGCPHATAVAGREQGQAHTCDDHS